MTKQHTNRMITVGHFSITTQLHEQGGARGGAPEWQATALGISRYAPAERDAVAMLCDAIEGAARLARFEASRVFAGFVLAMALVAGCATNPNY